MKVGSRSAEQLAMSRRAFVHGAALTLGAVPILDSQAARSQAMTGRLHAGSVDLGALAHAATRGEIKAHTPAAGEVAYLKEGGRQGIFAWEARDLASQVSVDRHEGLYIAPATDESGKSGAWVRVSDHVTPEMFGWTASSSATETASIINAAIEHARVNGLRYVDNGKRKIKGTITLGGTVAMEFGAAHTWTFDYSELERDYTEILERKAGESQYSGSGRFVAVDTSGAVGTSIRGRMTLVAARIGKMDLATRAGIPANLVAFSAATKTSGEITIETMNVFGFGYCIFQGDHRGRGQPSILGQTRMNVRLLFIRSCLVPFQSGFSGNGLDDMYIEVLRVSRCGGTTAIVGTDLNVASFFNFGLNFKTDREPGTISLTSGNPVGQLSEPNPLLRKGDKIAVADGNFNKNKANPVPFVAAIVEISGRRIVFDVAPERTVSGNLYVANPPTTMVSNGAINSLHHYVEGIHHIPVQLDTNGKISSDDFKVSNGEIGCRHNVPILATGMSGTVRVHLNQISLNDEFKYLIGFAPLHWPADPKGASYSQIVGDVMASGDYARETVESDIFTCVELSDDLRRSVWQNALGSAGPKVNVVAHFGSGDVRFSGCGPGSQSSGG